MYVCIKGYYNVRVGKSVRKWCNVFVIERFLFSSCFFLVNTFSLLAIFKQKKLGKSKLIFEWMKRKREKSYPPAQE